MLREINELPQERHHLLTRISQLLKEAESSRARVAELEAELIEIRTLQETTCLDPCAYRECDKWRGPCVDAQFKGAYEIDRLREENAVLRAALNAEECP